MEDIKESIKEIDEVIEESNNDVPLLKPKRKMKKFERSEKQKQAFAETMKKRAENVELRKQQKKLEAAKLLLELEQQKEQQKETKAVQEKKTKAKMVLPKSDSELSDEDTEEEEIYIKLKNLKNKHLKKYIS